MQDVDAAAKGTIIFSGDTLFQRGIGRTDLPGGDSKQILRSIRERLPLYSGRASPRPSSSPDMVR